MVESAGSKLSCLGAGWQCHLTMHGSAVCAPVNYICGSPATVLPGSLPRSPRHTATSNHSQRRELQDMRDESASSNACGTWANYVGQAERLGDFALSWL